MIFIRHRINTIAELGTVDAGQGCEIDLRSDVDRPGELHLSHDPWARGEPLEPWLRRFAQRKGAGPLIFNTKEDNLEERTLELCRGEGISEFFFLDTQVPTLVRLARDPALKQHLCVRVSSFESVGAALAFSGLVAWAWIDCFRGEPLPATEIARLKGVFKLCLVSPELQKRPFEEIGRFRELARLADAVCTKQPAHWQAVTESILT